MKKTLPLIAVMVAVIVMLAMAAPAAFAGPCHPHHSRSCRPTKVVQVIVDSESSKTRLVRVEEAVDAQSATVNAVVDAHNALAGRVERDDTENRGRDAGLRADLDREVEERRAVDAETADLLLDGVDADDNIAAQAAAAEAAAAEARTKAERLERELRALKEKK